MRKILSSIALLLACATPAAAAPVVVPPLHYVARTLPNGLRVFEMPDKSGTSASVQLWYDVGSKDDPKGRSGFAHLFEHLMFKATRDMPAETMDRLTEDVGGNNNASTDDDYTEYHETIPANHLERLIWAEAQRMGWLVVDQADFTSERDVVKEELRGDLARPYGRLFMRDFAAANFRVHPYALGTIGSIEELDAASLADVRAFHAQYYRPDNAVLVVSGNFDPKQLDGWIDRYFGPIAKPAWPIPRVTVQEPPRTIPARYVDRVENTPLPAVAISWLLPVLDDKDHAAINMIDGILSAGDSSRLHEDLVYRDEIASETDVIADFKKGAGTIAAFAIMAGNHSPAEGEAALRKEIARIRDTPPSKEEMTRVRNMVVTSALKQRETAQGRASLLGSGVILDGDPSEADKRLAALQTVTAADVQRVAARLLTDQTAVTITYLAPDAFPQVKGPAITAAPTIASLPLITPANVPVVTALGPNERAQPPAPGAPVSPSVPMPVERRLSNGMRVIVLERHALPIVTVHMIAPRGTAADPQGRFGLASLTADLLTKGTPTRNATQIAHTIENAGGSIDADATRDGTTITLTVKSDQLDAAMAVMADSALHSTFAQAELDRSRAEALDGLQQTYKTPASLAALVAGRAVYGDGAYGKPGDGTPASLPAIRRDDLLAAYRATWSPATSALILAGDITPDRAQALAEKLFGGWKTTAAPAPAVTATPYPAPRLIVVDLPGAPQAAVTIARPSIRRADPDFYVMQLANTALGGGYSARLNREIRVKRGLAYGASSRFSAGRLPGALSVATQTKNPTAPQVIGIMRDEMKGMGAEPVPAEELNARKASLIGSYGDAVETTDGIAGMIAGLVVQGVDPAEITRQTQKIAAIGPDEVQRVSKALIDPAVASVVVVGDARQFLPALRAQGLNPEVIPAAQLKLDSAALH
ncbi:zinc protease [Sphingomonas vulcanisoli]|uniref:Zinc protease n=1 Tax=Sphingomonas vulcanisoli TaxID=1658060 RepID=A0ABX0TP18_9SPHN|nr:pitrilysin family protein [Sphingomonas vulcanisoli]NIJ06509.1 zinc protease [Sphingomonas vulcanisoli]